MEDLPTLRLVVEKGPRKGETLERRPAAAAIRVGRVARGNTLAVRDPGASQRHLTFVFLPDTSRWAVTDLDTSNGTIVNDGDPIPPSVPFPLSHGDKVKIGESTSIMVEILGKKNNLGTEEEGGDKERPRGQRRRAVPPPMEPAVLEESDGAVTSASNRGRAKGRPKRGASTARVSKTVVNLATVAEEEPEEENVSAEKGRVRSRRPVTRSRTAKSSREDEKVDIHGSERDEILEIGVEEQEAKNRTRRRKPATRATTSKLPKDSEKLEENPIDVQIPKAEAAVNSGSLEVDTEGFGGDANPVGCSERQITIEEERMNMDKMTLGEWFDRMEKYLPMMINDVGEEIIASMKVKAQRLNEFVAANSREG